MIKINLEDTIQPHYASEDLMNYRFNSLLSTGVEEELIVQIKNINDPFLPNVFNIGFGPSDGQGGFDDSISLPHEDISRVFSTIILLAMTFLQVNLGTSIGIDGSDERRAYLYHRMFRYNYESLKEVLVITGVDWYVKLLRTNEVETDENGNALFKPRPEPFDLQRRAVDLYRYYLIDLKE